MIVFWLAHGWARALGLREAGRADHGLIASLGHERPVVEAVIPPLGALLIARLAGATEEDAITIAIWVCVGELGLLGAGVAWREGASALGVVRTAAGCAALGLAMVALKAVVH